MDEIIIMEESYGKVAYIPALKLVQIIWSGKLTNEQYQGAFSVALEFQEKSSVEINNFLSDTRNQGMVSPENRKWFEAVALPRAIRQGLKRGAVVFDGSVFKKYYLNVILQSSNKFKLPLKFFGTTEEAYNWFLSFNE